VKIGVGVIEGQHLVHDVEAMNGKVLAGCYLDGDAGG
jgi:hypothetical protein